MCACYVNADFLCATCSIKRICDQILYEKHKKRLAGQAFRNTSYICLIFICLEIRANDRSFSELQLEACCLWSFLKTQSKLCCTEQYPNGVSISTEELLSACFGFCA